MTVSVSSPPPRPVQRSPPRVPYCRHSAPPAPRAPAPHRFVRPESYTPALSRTRADTRNSAAPAARKARLPVCHRVTLPPLRRPQFPSSAAPTPVAGLPRTGPVTNTNCKSDSRCIVSSGTSEERKKPLEGRRPVRARRSSSSTRSWPGGGTAIASPADGHGTHGGRRAGACAGEGGQGRQTPEEGPRPGGEGQLHEG